MSYTEHFLYSYLQEMPKLASRMIYDISDTRFNRSTHEFKVLLFPRSTAKPLLCSSNIRSTSQQKEATPAFGIKKSISAHQSYLVKSSVFLLIAYLGPGRHWQSKLQQLKKPRGSSSVPHSNTASFPTWCIQYQPVWEHRREIFNEPVNLRYTLQWKV